MREEGMGGEMGGHRCWGGGGGRKRVAVAERAMD